MTLQEMMAQGQANNPNPGTMPSYAAGSLGDTYMKGLMADPTFQANMTAYKDPANWRPADYTGGDNAGTPGSGPNVYHNPNMGNMPGQLVNIPGVGWVNPNTDDPMGALRGGNVHDTADQTAGTAYNAIGFGQNGNLTSNNRLSTEANMGFGQTMLHDVLPLAAFVLGGGALAGAFGGAAAGAGAAGGAEAGGAGFTGAGINGMSGAGFSGAGINGMSGAGFAGAGVGGGAEAAGGGFSGGGTTPSGFGAGATDASGSSFGLGSGFNGVGADTGIAGGGDLSSFGALSPSAGGTSSGMFSGGIGEGANGGLGSSLGSGFNGIDVNGAIDAGTASGSSGLGGIYNQLKGLYKGPIGQTYRGASTLYDLYAAHQKAANAQNMMNAITNNFSQNGAYSQGLQRQLAAKDAAAGRNSQYGQRAVDLQQALASGNAQAMMSPAYQGLNSTYNTNKYGGLTSLSKLFGMGTNIAGAAPQIAAAAPAVGNAVSSAGDWLGSLF